MMGPQAGGGFINPGPQQPQPMDPMAQWSMQNQAQQQALMYAMHGMLNQQNQGTYQQAGMLGARGANYAFGNPVGQALQPLGSAVKSVATGAKNLVGLGAPQSYTQGGATTLAAGSPGLSTTAPASAAASSAVLDSAGPSLSQLGGSALSLAGSAYGAYEGMHSAAEATRRLHEALSYGVSQENEDQLRQQTFDNGMKSAAVGSLAGMVGGAIGGGGYGAIPGAILGGAGGATQAWNSADNNQQRWQMQRDFMEHPWR